LLFGQPIFVVIFWAVIIIAIFASILLFIWFIRRGSRSRYKTSIESTDNIELKPLVDSTTQEKFMDNWESEGLSASLGVVKDYYTIKTNPYTGKDRDIKKRITKSQLKPHLDKILDYVVIKLNYFRENYGKELIEDNYILETVLKFGSTSIELIINYKAIVFALKEIYPDSPEKKSDVDKLFLGAADILNSKELQEVIK
jgi:hypothetical protein